MMVSATNKDNDKVSIDMAIGNPQGSDFTKMLLQHEFKGVCCAANNIGDNEAFGIFGVGRDSHIVYINDHTDGSFIDSNGEKWKYAVPIKVSRLTQQDL